MKTGITLSALLALTMTSAQALDLPKVLRALDQYGVELEAEF